MSGKSHNYLFLLIFLLVVPATSHAQSALPGATGYPARPIRLIVPQGAGGTTDIISRITAQRMSVQMNQQIVIDNRTGAGGTIGVEIAANAAPDGYTLTLSATSTHALNPSLRKVPYHPLRDFAAVSLVATTPYVLVVHSTFAANSAAELIKLVRAKPGVIQYASAGNGTMPHMTAELFKSMAKLDMQHVPYKASPAALADVLGGRVPVYFAGVPSTLPHIKANRIRALGVTSLKRSVALPDLPAISEQAIPGYEAVPWIGLVAPAKTPQEIITRLNRELAAALATPEVRDQLLAQGAEPSPGTPGAHAAYIANELKKWGKVIADIGVKID